MIETDLIQLVIKNDRVAQKRLYQNYVRLVGHIAYRYVNNNNDVNDVVQNTFIRVFQNLQKFDSKKGKLKLWISKITINESISILRKRKKLNFSSIESVTDFEDKAFEEYVFLKLELENVTEIIMKLSDEERIIMDLFFYEQYSHQEISKLLNITIETSRVRLYRAKKSFFMKWNKLNANEIRRII